MRNKKARDLHRSLSDEQKRFVASRCISGNRPVEVWLDFFVPVAEADTARRQAWGLARLWRRKVDEPDGLRLCLIPWLRVLAEEASPSASLSLEVDLRGPDSSDKRISSSTVPPPGHYRIVRWREETHRDPWLAGSVELHDRSRLTFALTGIQRRRKIVKRSDSGRKKVKHKTKARESVEVTLSTRNDRYGPAGNHHADHIKVKPGVRRTTQRVRWSRQVTDKPRPAESFEHLMTAVEEAYRVVRPVVRPTNDPGR
jgi:hypothetical protein